MAPARPSTSTDAGAVPAQMSDETITFLGVVAVALVPVFWSFWECPLGPTPSTGFNPLVSNPEE